MWDNQAWSYLYRDDKDTEPPFLAQDFIHAVQPEARIVIMLRDPVERWNQHLLPVCHSASIFTAPLSVSVPRLYSDYLYFKVANKSAEDFHLRVLESVHLFQSCLSLRSLRSCVYNTSLSNAMPVTAWYLWSKFQLFFLEMTSIELTPLVLWKPYIIGRFFNVCFSSTNSDVFILA